MKRFGFSIVLLPLVALSVSCASVRERAWWLLPGTSGRLAGDAMITRDEWGVPHVRAESDAAAAFGLGYAQAEDDFERLEALYIRALGRSANLWGEAWLEPDVVRASFDVRRFAREEYDREPTHRKRIWDAFALGINHYLDTHPEVQPRLLHRFEGWHAFAVPRSRLIDAMSAGGSASAAAATSAAASSSTDVLGVGWAIDSSRTRDGRMHAVLELAGRAGEAGDLYEATIESESGWRFSGVWLHGTAAPVAGHDGIAAWSRSVSASAEVVGRIHALVRLPSDTTRFASGDTSVAVEQRVVELPVNSAAGVLPKAIAVRTTAFGPVVATRGDTAIVHEIVGHATGGLLPQLLEFSRADGLDAFSAVSAGAAPAGYVFYVDAEGRVARGVVGPTEEGLEQVDAANGVGLGAASGVAAAPGSSEDADGTFGEDAVSARFGRRSEAADDAVLARLGRRDARVAAILARLERQDAWSFDDFAALAVEASYVGAATEIARLVDVWERIGAMDARRAAAADAAIDVLRPFDGVIDTASAAATLYAEYAREVGALEGMDDAAADEAAAGEARAEEAQTGSAGGDSIDYGERLDALVRAAARLRRIYGDIDVPPARAWRLVGAGGAADTSGVPGIAVRAGPPAAGTIAAIRYAHGDAGSAGRVTHARTWVLAVALGASIDARSVVGFGHGDGPRPAAAAALKPLPFDSAAVSAAAVRRYRPGERPGG